MNFEEPQDPVSINGFPVYFTECALTEDYSLWVPGSISRNEVARCWRIAFYHYDGSHFENVHDSAYGSPHDTLKAAWDILVRLMESHKPYLLADQRRRAPGPKRDPLLETGFTGVHVTRYTKPNNGAIYKYVGVVAHQQLKKGVKTVNRPLLVGTVTRHQFSKQGPVFAQNRFERLLREAVAIRRYFNHRVSMADQPTELIRYEDVPESFKNMPCECNLDIETILYSY